MNHHTKHRYGSANFADTGMMQNAGLLNAHHGLYVGHDQSGYIVRSDQQAAVLLMGGARSGKGNHLIPMLTDGAYPYHIISMDWKGQNGAIAQLQVLQNRRVINIAPRGCKFPIHTVNPVSFAKADSETLIPDLKQFTQSFMPLSGSANAEFFEKRAQDFVVAVAVVLTRIKGTLTLPDLADVMDVFAVDMKQWTDIEFAMSQASESFIRAAAEEILQMRHSNDPNASGFGGIKAEIAKSFSCMADPQLRATVSAPYDFDFAELIKSDGPSYMINIMESMEFAKTSAPVIKALYACASIYKRRNLNSRPQLWMLDEIGNIGSWPMATELATYGPGYGIRPVYIVQSTAQLDNLSPKASQIIPNSCGTQIYKGVRDPAEGQRLSRMLGEMTLEVEDFQMNERARVAQQEAIDELIINGGNALDVGRKIAMQDAMTAHRTKMRRALMTPDEIMNMHEDLCLVFMSGKVPAPMQLMAPKYWKRKDLRGRYLGDPFHDTSETVSIAGGFWGSKTARVITEAVPRELAHWPQYKNGLWSFVRGYKPKISL